MVQAAREKMIIDKRFEPGESIRDLSIPKRWRSRLQPLKGSRFHHPKEGHQQKRVCVSSLHCSTEIWHCNSWIVFARGKVLATESEAKKEEGERRN